MRRNDSKFTLKSEHIKLLRRANVGWDSGETGAPAIDCKRPYGNSDVPGDVAKILGIEIKYRDDERDPDQENDLLALHRETETALQVILSTGSFEPGEYRLVRPYGSEWRRVG